jgi:hypothetical protein
MAKFAVMALALILANISAADADPNSGCLMHKALCRVPLAAQEVSTTDRWKVAVVLLQDLQWGRVLHSSGSVRRQAPRLFLRSPQCSGHPISKRQHAVNNRGILDALMGLRLYFPVAKKITLETLAAQLPKWAPASRAASPPLRRII